MINKIPQELFMKNVERIIFLIIYVEFYLSILVQIFLNNATPFLLPDIFNLFFFAFCHKISLFVFHLYWILRSFILPVILDCLFQILILAPKKLFWYLEKSFTDDALMKMLNYLFRIHFLRQNVYFGFVMTHLMLLMYQIIFWFNCITLMFIEFYWKSQSITWLTQHK